MSSEVIPNRVLNKINHSKYISPWTREKLIGTILGMRKYTINITPANSIFIIHKSQGDVSL